MGAQKWVDLNRYHSTKDCIKDLKNKGYQIVATTFFFGRETEGLSQEVMDEADVFLKIPMVGFTESLNISVSAAIILQHVTTKLRQTNIDWHLTEAEQQEKRLDWCLKTIKSHKDIVALFLQHIMIFCKLIDII